VSGVLSHVPFTEPPIACPSACPTHTHRHALKRAQNEELRAKKQVYNATYVAMQKAKKLKLTQQ
jgi:hypothetical protein